MDIVIKGMEMPKACFYCPMRLKVDPDDIRCLATGRTFEETFSLYTSARHEDCPLVPVPPHGRLIDAEVLCERLITAWHTTNAEWRRIIGEVMSDVVVPIVMSTPTIIPAEEGKA